MLFNSFEFIVFLPIVFLLYWFVFKQIQRQNALIVAVSYLFYGWWDWRFLILIAFTTFCSYFSGILIEKYDSKRNLKWCISASNIILNLGILCVFKYFNFFGENLAALVKIFGGELDWVTMQIILPVGISFYTFQALSYSIDVYKKKINATRDIGAFFAFISFFPQLVAGPIERGTNLLPQFLRPRQFNYANAVDGCRQMLWGFFKKMVIADNCAFFVNKIFADYPDYSGSTLLIGGILFSFQIYGDFSGYSDIAIGCARLFGINLMQNFHFPYFSRNIAEFWRRWHISLNTWFRDYVYIPLGGSKVPLGLTVRNTFVIFLLSGFWHGANWTYVIWGVLHALLFIPLLIKKNNRKHLNVVAKDSVLPSWKELGAMLSTFLLVMFAWIIFRSDTISDAYRYISQIFTASLFAKPAFFVAKSLTFYATIFFIALLLLTEWYQRKNIHGLSRLFRSSTLNMCLYVGIIFMILFFAGSTEEFIYFQF